jgi:plasmid stabilization system protein ParE
MKPALFHHLADRELAEAIQFYEDRVPGLGSRFHDHVRRAVDFLREFPLASPVLDYGVRKRVVRKFPYNVLYSVEDDYLFILAVAHHKRRPNYWIDRLK